jgi:DNA-directed RNA polymerase II subunit RPB3
MSNNYGGMPLGYTDRSYQQTAGYGGGPTPNQTGGFGFMDQQFQHMSLNNPE